MSAGMLLSFHTGDNQQVMATRPMRKLRQQPVSAENHSFEVQTITGTIHHASKLHLQYKLFHLRR
jgi:hypothetical protein